MLVPLVQSLLLTTVGACSMFLAKAAGAETIGQMIKLTMILGLLLIFFGVIGDAILAVSGFFQKMQSFFEFFSRG